MRRTPESQAHLAELSRALEQFEASAETADRWGREMASRCTRGCRVLAAGNGGSAAQAQHLTAELVGRYRDERRPFSAICLSAETSSLTAIANDYPADELFARQVEAHGRRGDTLVLLSTSGRSANVVTAARRGSELGLRVLAMTGPEPNPLAAAATESIAVDAPFTATVQELHLVALHIVCAGLDHALGVCESASIEDVRSVVDVGRDIA
jgi:D-sedoheptulose 7-phosphate isomerase